MNDPTVEDIVKVVNDYEPYSFDILDEYGNELDELEEKVWDAIDNENTTEEHPMLDDIITPYEVKWSSRDKGKYTIMYTTLPGYYMAKAKGKVRIPNTNNCNETELYIFKNFDQMEKFFEDLLG